MMLSRPNRFIIASLLSACLTINPIAALAQDDPYEPIDEEESGTLSEVVVGAIMEKCECPDVQERFAAFERCLKKNKKKAYEAFKPGIRFLGERTVDFKSELADAVQQYSSECEELLSDPSEDEDPENDFPETGPSPDPSPEGSPNFGDGPGGFFPG